MIILWSCKIVPLVPAHIEHYSEIVQEKYLRRRLIEKSVDMIESAYRDEHEASVIIGEAESSLFDLSGNKDDKFRIGKIQFVQYLQTSRIKIQMN